MVFHDQGLQLFQFERSRNGFKMLGFNEVSLIEGLVRDGEILNMDAFKDILVGLFSEATPRAIQTKNLHVNVPFELLYTFVQDSSYKSNEDALRTSIMETVRGHFPIDIGDLVLDFDSLKKDRHVSYAVYGSPKKWRERFMKVCKEVGISSVDFIPEPICQMALHEDLMQEDAALFSHHRGEIFISLFHNGLLYDSYLVGEATEDQQTNFSRYRSEFNVAQQDFMGRFNVPIKTIFFVGFEKDQKGVVRKLFDSVSEPLVFLEPKNSKLGQMIPYEIDKSTLFGLFNMLVSEKNLNFQK